MSHLKDSLLEHFQQGVGLHVVLVDLLPPMHEPEDWYVKFCQKMRTRKLVGFSNKFQNVHTIESIHVGSRPSDVAISRRCNCILVCFPLMVQVFNLCTKQWQISVKTKDKLSKIVVEASECGDSVIISCVERKVYKYGLEQFIKKGATSFDWVQTNFTSPKSVAVDYSTKSTQDDGPSTKKQKTNQDKLSSNRLYVTDDGDMCIKVLNSANGEILHIIKTIGGSSDIFKPVALAFNSLNQLLLLESPPRFEIVYEEDHSKWKSKAQLDTRMMQNPKGIIYEENSRQILVCDKRNFRLLVFTEDGKYVCSYESTQGGFVPEGLCYDDHTGELYVASSLDCRVLIFK